MTPFANPVGFATLVRREMVRTYKIINQVIWPPIITTVLYVVVFGLALGSRIKTVQGVPYAAFLIPGLIMLQVIDGAYGECSSSLFQGRFLNSIQELLVAPLSAVEIVFGYLISGVLRAAIVASLILSIGILLVRTVPQNWFVYFAMMILVAVLFSSLGVVFGLIAEKYDHIAVLTTFVITPLVFIGGVFTSIEFLPPAVRIASYFNPMFYMIDGFRYSFTLQSDVPLAVSFGVVGTLTVLATGAALRMFAAGYKLRT